MLTNILFTRPRKAYGGAKPYPHQTSNDCGINAQPVKRRPNNDDQPYQWIGRTNNREKTNRKHHENLNIHETPQAIKY